jgi:hypothetical protein
MVQTKLRGMKRIEWMFVLKSAASYLMGLPRLLTTGSVRPEAAQGRARGFVAPGKWLKTTKDRGYVGSVCG